MVELSLWRRSFQKKTGKNFTIANSPDAICISIILDERKNDPDVLSIRSTRDNYVVQHFNSKGRSLASGHDLPFLSDNPDEISNGLHLVLKEESGNDNSKPD